MKNPYLKPIRLTTYDYSVPGLYFITICTDKKEQTLCKIAAENEAEYSYSLLPLGQQVEQQLNEISHFYGNAEVTKYVIMPNHVHFILEMKPCKSEGKPCTTSVFAFVGSFKRLCNKKHRKNIWQQRFYDHVIRNEAEYLNTWNYIDGNPSKWADDDYYRHG